jgi:hypothetical protein
VCPVFDADLDKIPLADGPIIEDAKADYDVLIERLGRPIEPDLPGVRPLLLPPGGDRLVYGLTQDGETITNSPGFGAAFDGGKQITVRAGGEILGQIPGGHNLKPGDPCSSPAAAGRCRLSSTVLRQCCSNPRAVGSPHGSQARRSLRADSWWRPCGRC